MRESERCTFVSVTPGEYVGGLIGYTEEKVIEDRRACNISDLGIDVSVKLFGDYRVDRKVIRLGLPYQIGPQFSRVEIAGERYDILLHRLGGSVFYVQKGSVQ